MERNVSYSHENIDILKLKIFIMKISKYYVLIIYDIS